MSEKSIWIPTYQIPKVKKFISKNKKKAKQLGLDIPNIKIMDEVRVFPVPRYTTDRFGNTGSAEYLNIDKQEVRIEGDVPVLDNWFFLASISHEEGPQGERINIVKTSPYLEAEDEQFLRSQIKELSECEPNCEHCNVNRERNNTFLVKHVESGEVKQVGSTCVDDFLGDKSLDKALAIFKLESIMNTDWDGVYEEDFEAGRINSKFLPIRLVVAVSDYINSNFGFTPSSQMDGANSLRMVQAFHQPTKEIQEIIDAHYLCQDNRHIKRAEELMEWLKESDLGSGTYIANSQGIIKRGYANISDRFDLGVTASWPHVYNKHLEKVNELKGSKNEHFSEVKKRGCLKLRCSEIQEKQYAQFPYVRYSLKDDDGRTFQWKTSFSSDPGLEIGKTYSMVGTIKAFDEFNDVKITQLARCAQIEECDPSEKAPDFLSKPKPRKKKPQANGPGI